MSRVALGHVGSPMVLAYVLATRAAASRAATTFFTVQSMLLAVAALLRALAFAVFMAVYWPILTHARVDGQPG